MDAIDPLAPYVIVNRYAEQAWGTAGERRDGDTRWPIAAKGLLLFDTRRGAEAMVAAERARPPRVEIDDDECAIMPLHQYLIEFGHE